MQISSEQIKSFAMVIKDDIKNYLDNHPEAYARFLEKRKEEKNDQTIGFKD